MAVYILIQMKQIRHVLTPCFLIVILVFLFCAGTLTLSPIRNRPIVQEVVQIPNQEEFQTQRDRTEGKRQTAIELKRSKIEEIAPSSHHDLIVTLI